MDKKKFDQIDSLLFFAVFAVVCSHWQWSGRVWMELSPLGRRGVDLFFVISGFLITLGLIASKEKPQTRGQSLYKFYIRRFLRIFPIYYLTLFIVFIFWYQQMQGSLWWYILYMVNFYCIKMQSFGVAGLFWSLSVEEQFYLAWPLIILFTPNKRLPIVITLSILLSLIFKIYWAIMKVSWWTPYMHPMGSLDVLAMGGMLAYLYYFHFELLKKLVNNPLVMCFVIRVQTKLSQSGIIKRFVENLKS